MFKNFTLLSIIVKVLFSSIAFAQFPERNMLSIRADTNLINEIKNAEDISQHDPIQAQQMMYHALQLSLKDNYGKGIRNAAYQLMTLSYNQKYFPETINYANLLISYCSPPEHMSKICDALLLKGMSYNELEKFDRAIENYQKSIFFAPDKIKVAYAYSNISTVMYNIRAYHKALSYSDKAVEIAPEIANSIFLCNKALTSISLGDKKNALIYFDSAYHIAEDTESKASVLFRKTLFLSEHGKYQEALNAFKQFKPSLSNPTLSPRRKGLIFLTTGIAYNALKDYKNAEKYLLDANELKQFFSKSEQRVLMHKLSEFYYATKDYKKAFDLHKLSHRLEDRAKSKDILLTVNELETKYRTAEKDKAIAEQQAIISKNESIRYKDRLLAATLIAGLVILLLLLWLRYYYLRQKNLKLRSEQEISRLQAMMEGEEKERTRLSHELHDGVNSSLAATTSYLQTVEQLYPEMSVAEPFVKVKQLLESTSAEIRSVAHNLAPHILIKNGLKYAIEDFCANLFSKEVAIEVQSFGDEQYLSEDTALFMYRIAQELLHNVRKHAEATEVIVAIGVLESEVSLTIEDNGIGIQHNGEKKSGIGLDSMKERIRSYNGELTIESGQEKGTVVYVCVRFEM